MSPHPTPAEVERVVDRIAAFRLVESGADLGVSAESSRTSQRWGPLAIELTTPAAQTGTGVTSDRIDLPTSSHELPLSRRRVTPKLIADYDSPRRAELPR
jgi:hypothetical protein